MKTPEGRVKDAVRKLLRSRGIWFYQPVQNGMGVVGIPDFVCCWGGRFLGVETKAPGKLRGTTVNQQRVLQQIQDHGGLSVVVDDVSQLEEFLNAQVESTEAGVPA